MKAYLEQQKGFWNGLAEGWSEANMNPVVGHYANHEAWPDYEFLFTDVGDTTQMQALEYGCGPARNQIKYHSRFKRVDGVDIGEKNIEIAIERTKNLDPRPLFWVTSGDNLNMIPDESYDYVFSVICMQHINNWQTRQNIYKEIFRVLKPGGFFVAQMGFGLGHKRSVDYYDVSDSYKEADTRVTSPSQLEKDLLDKGFGLFNYVIKQPCCDEHPNWIWFKVRKPS